MVSDQPPGNGDVASPGAGAVDWLGLFPTAARTGRYGSLSFGAGVRSLVIE